MRRDLRLDVNMDIKAWRGVVQSVNIAFNALLI